MGTLSVCLSNKTNSKTQARPQRHLTKEGTVGARSEEGQTLSDFESMVWTPESHWNVFFTSTASWSDLFFGKLSGCSIEGRSDMQWLIGQPGSLSLGTCTQLGPQKFWTGAYFRLGNQQEGEWTAGWQLGLLPSARSADAHRSNRKPPCLECSIRQGRDERKKAGLSLWRALRPAWVDFTENLNRA